MRHGEVSDLLSWGRRKLNRGENEQDLALDLEYERNLNVTWDNAWHVFHSVRFAAFLR